MANINRLKKFFKNAENCLECDGDLLTLKEAILFIVKHCRSQNMNDEQLSGVLADAFTDFF